MATKKESNLPARGTNKKPVKSVSPIVDVHSATVEFIAKTGGKVILDLLPISDDMLAELALLQLYNECKGKKDPVEHSLWVKSGRPRKVRAPLIVQAIAEASRRDVAECFDVWKKMPAKDKAAMKKDPEVQRCLLDLKKPKGEATDKYLDYFG